MDLRSPAPWKGSSFSWLHELSDLGNKYINITKMFWWHFKACLVTRLRTWRSARSIRVASAHHALCFCVSQGMFQALPLPSVLTSTSSLPEEEKLKPGNRMEQGGWDFILRCWTEGEENSGPNWKVTSVYLVVFSSSKLQKCTVGYFVAFIVTHRSAPPAEEWGTKPCAGGNFAALFQRVSQKLVV